MKTDEEMSQSDPGTSKSWIPTNEEREQAGRKLWDWVVKQPQTVWLNIVRYGNPDEWELYWIDMVKHPRCDRAVASYLFWKLQPSHFLTADDRPYEDGCGSYEDMMAAILDRAESGGWPTSKVHYDRIEIAREALETARTIATSPTVPFAIPRQLCANFEGDNDTPTIVGSEPIEDVEPLFGLLDSTPVLVCSAEVRADRQLTGEYHYDQAFALPARAIVTDDMTDLQAITAVFGDWEPALSKVAAVDAEREAFYAEARKRNAALTAAHVSVKPSPRRATGTAHVSLKPARRWWPGVARFVIMNAIGAAAMIAALHFAGSMAAVMVLIVWIGVLLHEFL